jgi:hypothetical protein
MSTHLGGSFDCVFTYAYVNCTCICQPNNLISIFIQHVNVKNANDVHLALESLFNMLMLVCACGCWMHKLFTCHFDFLSMFFQHVFIKCQMNTNFVSLQNFSHEENRYVPKFLYNFMILLKILPLFKQASIQFKPWFKSRVILG